MESDLLTQYPELKRLARRIRRSQGEFSLFFVECNLPTLRYELANVLSEELEMSAVQVTLPSLSEHLIQFDQLIAEHIKDEPSGSSVFLFGLENWLPTLSKETLHQTVQQLNWRRSAFARLQRPLVIWLPKYALDLLAEHTPDFFDWYSGVFVFKGGEQAQGLEITTSLDELYSSNDTPLVHGFIKPEEARRWIHTLNSLLSESKELNETHIRLLNEIALLYKKLGDLDKALDYLEQSLAIVQNVDRTLDEGTVLNNLSQVYAAKGEDDKALSYLKRSLVIQREVGNKHGEGTTLNNLSKIYQNKGEVDKALEYLRQALRLAEITGSRASEALVLNNISSIYEIKKDYDVALEYLEKTLQIEKEIGDSSGGGLVHKSISRIFKAKGNLDEALRHLRLSLDLQKEVNNKPEEAVTLNSMALIMQEKGNYEASQQLFEKSLRVAQECGEKLGEGKALYNIAQVYSSKNEFDNAIQYLERSLKVIRETGDSFNEPSIISSIGSNYWGKGDKNIAFNHWLKAYGMAKEVGNIQVLESIQVLTSQLGFDEGEMKDWEIRAEKLKYESLPKLFNKS